MNQELENFKKKEITENEKSLTEVNNLEKWKKNSKNFNYSKRDENHQKECKDVFNEKNDLEDNLVVNLNSVVVKKNNLEVCCKKKMFYIKILKYPFVILIFIK